MNSLSNYINDDIQYINYINEALENNTRIINENQLVVNHAKDIDNLLYKFKTYTHNNLYHYNSINESDNTYQLSLNEQNTFRDLMIFICEDYRDKLLEELNIYESLIVDGELITEGKFVDKIKNKSKNLVDNIKATWDLGKDKVNQAIENIKTKIKEVNELIKEYATKAVKTVKEMAVKLVSLLSKFDCTLEGLFSKMGFNTDDEEKSVSEIGQQLASNTDYLKKNDVYESYANSLNIINEEENSKEGEGNQNIKDKGETQKQTKSTKQMLWDGFKQLMVWAGVCVVIPGFVCGLFPGTFIALIVPIACKLLWNGYKIYKLIKQWKTVKKEWSNYNKTKKIITVCGMIFSIIALIYNFNSAFEGLGKIYDAFVKSGSDLFAQANLGIQPDVLTRAFGAVVKMIKEGKFSFEDFEKSFKAITDSFAEHIPQADKVIKTTAKIGKSGKELLDEYGDKTFKTSTKAWTEFLKPAGMDPNKINPKGVYDVVMDGNKDAEWFKKLTKFAADNGVKLSPDKGFNTGLNKLCSNAGSITGAKMPGWLIKKAMDEGISIGNNKLFSILGGVIETTQNLKVDDIINAATSMLVTIPSVEVAPENKGGFRVRLGGKDDKDNFVYEVGKDGVKKHKVSDYQKEYDKIKSKVAGVNKKFLEDLLKNDELSDEDKNKIKKDLEEFESNYKEKINTEDCIIFYGTRYKEEKTNESFRSLYDYIINEAENKISIDDIKQNFIDLKKLYLTKIGNENNKTTDDQKKGHFKGNTEMILGSIFTLDDKYKTSKFKWKEDYEPTPYELVKKRANDDDKTNDVFGPEDIELLAVHYCIWKGPDNEKTYQAYVKAFIDAAILKSQFMNNENEDVIIASYKRLIDNLLKVESIANDVKDKEWKPKEEWAPIKIDENDIDSKTLKKVKDTENNDAVETSKDKAEDELEKSEVPLPWGTDDKEKQKQDDSSDNSKEENDESDGKEVPVLMLANNYGIDLASATKSGPRKDVYALKGIFDSLTFSTIDGGASVDDITEMLGEILHAQTNNLMSVSANRPCNKDENDKKFTLNDKINKGDDERPDFGMLTNQEITDVLNKPENAVKLIKGKSSKYTIAQTEEDKKTLDKKKNEFKGKLENPDEETVKLVKEIDPKLVDDKGKIKDTDKLSDTLSNYSLAKDKAEGTKKSGGFFTKLKNFVKGLFGGSKDEGKKYNNLLKHFEKKNDVSESLQDNLNEYDKFLNECFRRVTLSEYIKLKKEIV